MLDLRPWLSSMGFVVRTDYPCQPGHEAWMLQLKMESVWLGLVRTVPKNCNRFLHGDDCPRCLDRKLKYGIDLEWHEDSKSELEFKSDMMLTDWKIQANSAVGEVS